MGPKGPPVTLPGQIFLNVTAGAVGLGKPAPNKAVMKAPSATPRVQYGQCQSDANHASGLDEALPGLWTTEDRRVPSGGSDSNVYEPGKKILRSV